MPTTGLLPTEYCTKDKAEFSVNPSVTGTVCTSDVYLLRMAWNKAEPLVCYKYIVLCYYEVASQDTLEDVGVLVSNVYGSSMVPWRHYRLTHMDGYMCTLPSTYHHNLTWLLPAAHSVDVTSYSTGMYAIRPEDYVTLSHDFVMLPDHVSVGGDHEPIDTNDIPTVNSSTL